MTAQGTGGERELTGRAIGFGLVLGSLLAAGNVYSGLKLAIIDGGMTVTVLLAFALFAALRRPMLGLEANIAQAAGSSAAVMGLTAGVVGPIPALAMGGHAPSPVWIALLGVALGVLGALLAVPFRRQLIEDDALPFPSGQATGELIKSLAAELHSARGRVLTLFIAFGAAVLVVVLRDGWHLVPADLMLPLAISGIPAATLGVGVNLSPLILGVGTLVGPRAALSWLAGSLVAWVVLAPALYHRGAISGPDYGSAVSWLLWPGASLMVASSLGSLAFSAGDLRRAWVRRRAARQPTEARRIRIAALLCGAAVVAIGWIGFGVNPIVCVAGLVLAALFTVVAMRATGETDQSPAGPLGGFAQILIGATAPGSTLPTLFAGAVTSGAGGHASSMMLAWKAGHVVGGSPRRVLVAQLLGVGVGAVVSVLVYALLDRAYGIGSAALPSPAAISWKATADVVQGGLGTMPPGAPLAALIAAAVGVGLARLERGPAARLVPSPVALGIGFIVPASFAAGIALGALAFALLRRVRPTWSADHGPSLAAGLITGEALTALVFATLLVVGLL